MENIAADPTQYNIPFAVLTVLALAVLVVFGASIVVFFVTIRKYITSGGKDDKIKEAANSVRHLITGIVLTIVFLFVMPLIFQKLEIRWYEYYSAKNIFARAGEILQSVLNVENFSMNDASTSQIFNSNDTIPTYAPDTSL
jgi:formate hydrogenlyase subunit 3/multisubunit Na+/H+ antiporter MnhD subunit